MSNKANESTEQEKNSDTTKATENLNTTIVSNLKNTSKSNNPLDNKSTKESDKITLKKSEEILQKTVAQNQIEVRHHNLIQENKNDNQISLNDPKELSVREIKKEIIELEKQINIEKTYEKNKIRASSSNRKNIVIQKEEPEIENKIVEKTTKPKSSKTIIILDEDIKKSNKPLEYAEINEKIINSKIEQNYDYNEILSDINLLLSKKAKIEKIVKTEFFIPEDFQILNNKEASKLPFIINIMNYINILNCVFEISKNDILQFHRLLLLIKSKFTYVERDDGSNIIDFGFLTNVSSLIVPHIIKKGETGFDDESLNELSKKFCSDLKKSNTDVGYIFEESNKEYLFNELNSDNLVEIPTIIYYLNSTCVQKLYQNKIINVPQIYSLNDKKTNGEDFSGYNEFDICFQIKNDCKINQNNQFNILQLRDGKIFEDFKFNNEISIEFKKDTIYIIEVKRNSYELYGKSEAILRKKNAFIQAYNNVVYKELYTVKNYDYVLLFICNKNRKEIVKNISNLKINTDVFYSNPNISLNAISSLSRDIYELNMINNTFKNDIILLKSDKDKKDKQIQTLRCDKNKNDKQIKELQKDKETKDKQIKELQKDKETKDKQIKELQQDKETKDKQIKELQQDKETKNKLIQDLQEHEKTNEIKIKEHEDMINSLKRQLFIMIIPNKNKSSN